MKSIFKNLDDLFFAELRNYYLEIHIQELKNCESLLDVGCGSNSPVQHFSKNLKRSVGVDTFQPSIDQSKMKDIHNEYYMMNVLEMDKFFPEKSFDCVIATDLIEHLEKQDGFKLIEIMEKLAKKKVIIFTPNGFLEQKEYDGNKYQVHLSGWDSGEMKKLGYRVIGINGWKFLRGEMASIRFRPKFLWWRVSLLSQYFTTRNSKYAFAILCIKEMNSLGK